MKLSKHKCELALWLACALLATVTIALQLAALLLDYETDANYFVTGTLLPVLAPIFAGLSALCGVIAAILFEKKSGKRSPLHANVCNPLSCVLGAIGCLSAAILLVLSGRTLFALGTALCLLLSCIYLLLCLIGTGAKKQFAITPWLGMLAILGTILLNAYYYFDASVEMNAPIKTYVQFSLLFLMLTLTAELRYLFDTAKPRLYLALHACFLASTVLAVPMLLFVFFSERLLRLDYFAGGLLLLFFLPASILRILSVRFAKELSLPTEVTEAPEEADQEAPGEELPANNQPTEDKEED